MIKSIKSAGLVRQEFLAIGPHIGQHGRAGKPVVVWPGADDLRFVFQRILQLFDIIRSFGNYIITIFGVPVEGNAVVAAIIQENKSFRRNVNVSNFGKRLCIRTVGVGPVSVYLMGIV